MVKKNYPQEPTDEAKVDSSLYDARLIGEKEDTGAVIEILLLKNQEVYYET